MDVARFDKATSWAMLLQQVKYVLEHSDVCRTLVIDTADWAGAAGDPVPLRTERLDRAGGCRIWKMATLTARRRLDVF